MSLDPNDAGAVAPLDTGTADVATAAPAKEPTLMQKSLALVKTTVKDLDSIEAGMARLRKKYENVVFDVKTTKGMKEATEARMAIREPRYKLKNALDAGKKQLNTLKADLTARAEALTADIMSLETPIHEQIVAEETRKAKEKEEREAADRARILAITERIAAIRATALRASECRTSERVSQIWEALQATDLTGFDEFEDQGMAAYQAATETVRSIYTAKAADEREREEARAKREAEEARLKAAAEALAAQQAELARQAQELADKQAAFLAQQQVAAVEKFEAAASQHEAKPLPADATPAHAALHEIADKAVELGREILEDFKFQGDVREQSAQVNAYEFLTGQPALASEDVREQPAQAAEANTEGEVVDAEISAGFDFAMSAETPAAIPLLKEPTDQEIADLAIESVASYYDITEQEAALRLSRVRAWNYQGHALAA